MHPASFFEENINCPYCGEENTVNPATNTFCDCSNCGQSIDPDDYSEDYFT